MRDYFTKRNISKKKIISVFITLIFIVALFVSYFNPIQAVFNKEINYQGKLTLSSGVAVPNTSYSIVFSLYTVSTGGSNIWTETRSVTTSNGLFSEMLGSSSSLASVDFNQTLYLGVKVGADAEMLPRKKLGMVPAAMESQNAAVSTTSTLIQDDSTNATNYPLFSDALTGNENMRTDAGYTYNPSTGILTATSFAGALNGTIGATTANTGVFTTATTNTGLMPDANDGAYLGQAGTAFSDLFLAEGGVINWDSGDATLTQVGDLVTLAGADLIMATSLGSTGTRVLKGWFTNLEITNLPTVNGGTLATALGLSNYVPYTGGTSNVDLGVHNLTVDTNSLFVDSVNHRVGIGTTGPSNRLVVGNGVTSIERIIIDSGTQSHLQFNQAGVSKWFISNNDVQSGSFGIYDADATGGNGYRLAINNSGNVGIGYDDPGTAKLAINGNVGIGTTAPLSKLAINGGLHVGGDSDAGDNNILADGTITGTQLVSNIATGTSPLSVASTTLVSNLNADLLDGKDSSEFALVNDSVYYIEGTGTVAGTWLGANSKITSYYDGLTIRYYIPVAGAATTTLDINSLGVKTIYYAGATKLTTHYPALSVVTLTYSSTQNGGSWFVEPFYADGTESYTVRWNSTLQAGTQPIYDYKLVMFGATDGKVYPLTSEEGTATTKTVSSVEFNPMSPILFYNRTTNIAMNGTSASYWYEGVTSSLLNYTANQASGWTAYTPIYLKGTITSSGNFLLAGAGTSTNPNNQAFLTQTLPTTEDGFVYILLGHMYDTTTGFRLTTSHPIYEYKSGKLRPYINEVDTLDTILTRGSTTNSTISAPIFQGNSAGVTFGNASYATTIAGSALTISPTSWTATPTISGLITATSGLTSNGTLTLNGGGVLGDGGDDIAINSNDWDIGSTGAVSGLTTIGMSGQLTSTLAIGTSPFAVTSTTVNTNLNADLLDGQSGAYYLDNTDAQTLGTSGTTITLTGSTAVTAPYATYAGAVTLTADNSTNATNYPLFTSAATGNLSPRTDTGYTYNPSTGILTATGFDPGGTTLYGSRAITVDTGGVLNIDIGSAAGDDFTIDTSKLVVEGDTGNVGIGTATPTLAKLQVDSSTTGGNNYSIYGYAHNTATEDNQHVGVVGFAKGYSTYGGVAGVMGIADPASSWFSVGMYARLGSSVPSMSFVNDTALYADGGSLGYSGIFMNGNVGIGTTAPLSKLSINGGLHVGGDSDAGDNNLLVDGNITAPRVIGGVLVSSTLIFQNTAVATGTTASAVAMRFYTGDNDGSPIEAMTILNDGKVGINNVAPSEALDVGGNIETSGSMKFTNGFLFEQVASPASLTVKKGTDAIIIFDEL